MGLDISKCCLIEKILEKRNVNKMANEKKDLVKSKQIYHPKETLKLVVLEIDTIFSNTKLNDLNNEDSPTLVHFRDSSPERVDYDATREAFSEHGHSFLPLLVGGFRWIVGWV